MYQLESSKNLRAFPIISLIVVIGFTVLILAERSADVVFQFPEYDYKETSKNVRIIWNVYRFIRANINISNYKLSER